MATGQEGTFGESGERISAMVEETPANSRELLARVDFAPDTDAGMESMLGFRQDLGFAGSVQSVAAIAIHPEIDASGGEGGAGGAGLDEAAMRTWETLNLGDELEAEVGSTQVLARFAENSPNTMTAALPFASVGWRTGTLRFVTGWPACCQARRMRMIRIPGAGCRRFQCAMAIWLLSTGCTRNWAGKGAPRARAWL